MVERGVDGVVEVGACHVADSDFVFADPDLDRGHVEVVKLLVDCGAQQDYKDEDGRSPLTIARICGQTLVVKILSAQYT